MNSPDAIHGPDHRVLLCVSNAFDAQIMRNILGTVNAKGVFCRYPEEIARQAHDGADAVLVSEEVLDENSLEPIIESLSRQPEWSDLPVLLVRRSAAESPVVLRAMQGLTNILLLDRPMRMAAMASALTQALRARRRQYRLKDLLAELQHSRRLLTEAEKLSHTGAWEWDLVADKWTFSDEWLQIHGCSDRLPTPDELMTMAHPEDRPAVKSAMENARRGLAIYDLEHRIVRKNDGSVRFVHARGRHITNASGEVVKIYGFARDITERRKREEQLRETAARIKASLEEKEVLLKEIHHRVKNNMQVISSLIFLQADVMKDADMRDTMEDLAHRVRSMAMVHERLYQSEDLARVDFADYARSLLEYLWRAYGTASGGIRLVLDLEPVNLSVITAVHAD